MYDLGAVVPLGIDVRDGSGNLANAETVALTVTLGGTTATPTVANPPAQTGRYTYDYVTTAPGRHVVRWSTANPATAYTDVFHVAADWLAIVGLAETKDHLNIPSDDTTADDELRGFIASASLVVEDIVGVVCRRAITETNSGGSRHVTLSHKPVLDVVEVVADGTTIDPGDYTASPSGLLARRSGVWPAGLRNISVTYMAGRTIVPANIIDGTKDLIRINWRPQAGGNYSAFDGGRADDFSNAAVEASMQGNLRLGFFVPNTVVQRLSPDQRGPVVL